MNYIIKRQISTGSFGTIYEVLSEDDDKVYALKELTNIDTVTKQRFEREIQVLSQLDHQILLKSSNGILEVILRIFIPIM